MKTCASCRRDHPDSDRFCRYCGVEVNPDTLETAPLSRPVRAVSVLAAVAVLVLCGIWLQTRSVPVRASEVSGQRETPTAVPEASPEVEAAFVETEALLTIDTGSLVVIAPEMDKAVVLHPNAPRRHIPLPPATSWEITDDAFVGFTDDDRAHVIAFSHPDQVTEVDTQKLYTDLDGDLVYTWRDGNRLRVRPVFDDANASSGDFSAAAPMVAARYRGEKTIGPLLTTFDGDTYGWHKTSEWKRVASGVSWVASDPLITTRCDRDGSPNSSCALHVVDLQTGRSVSRESLDGTSRWEYLSDETAFPSPDLAWVFNAADRTLIDMSRDATQPFSVPSRNEVNAALWSLDSSIVGVAGDGLRLFSTSGEILADVIRTEDSIPPHDDASMVKARFVPSNAFGPGR